MEKFKEILPYLIPLLILQLALWVVALRDLSHRQHTRLPKWAWVLIIILGEMFGAIVYLLWGRGEDDAGDSD